MTDNDNNKHEAETPEADTRKDHITLEDAAAALQAQAEPAQEPEQQEAQQVPSTQEEQEPTHFIPPFLTEDTDPRTDGYFSQPPEERLGLTLAMMLANYIDLIENNLRRLLTWEPTDHDIQQSDIDALNDLYTKEIKEWKEDVKARYSREELASVQKLLDKVYDGANGSIYRIITRLLELYRHTSEQEANAYTVITEALPEIRKIALYKDITESDLLLCVNPDGTPAVEYLQKMAHGEEVIDILKRARAKLAIPILPAAKAQEGIGFPVDKVNRIIFDLNTYQTQRQIPGQAQLSQLKVAADVTATGKSGKKKNPPVLLPIILTSSNTEGLQNLDSFDRFVFDAVCTIYAAGYTEISARQIFMQIGGKGSKPNTKQISKITDSLEKMFDTNVQFTNAEEARRYNYPLVRIKDRVLPGTFIEVSKVNGARTASGIRLDRTPPLYQMAVDKKQITTLPLEVMQDPVQWTDRNFEIKAYLLDRIAPAKRSGKNKERILLNTIYISAGIATESQLRKGSAMPEKARKATERATKPIRQYLEHYKQTGYIKDWKQLKNSKGEYVLDIYL